MCAKEHSLFAFKDATDAGQPAFGPSFWSEINQVVSEDLGHLKSHNPTLAILEVLGL